MSRRALPRAKLAHLPTPLETLPRLTAALGGPQLYVKRDDLTGLAFGGNKTRKLELLAAEAQAAGAHTLVTRGAPQSNHCRQTAAAAARLGFECILVLAGSRPGALNGNLLLDRLLGAQLVWTEGRDPDAVLEEVVEAAASDGRRPFRIPYGGSSAVGAAAYAEAMAELMEQDARLDRVVFASSSGGTQAGLVAGARLHGFGGKILGISVDRDAASLRSQVAGLAEEVLELHGERGAVSAEEVLVDDGYRGGGYAVLGELEREAVEMFARLEGLLLDPVYTGRAAGALVDLIRRGQIGRQERVLFWHTGGSPALFAYAEHWR